MDDDPDMRSVFMRSFRYTQAAIDVAESPMQAIEMATSTDYCVVITDLQMPGMSGLELVEALWQARPMTSFVLVTGIMELNLPTDRPSARAISSMIRKPWLPEQIDVAMLQAIELHDRRVAQQFESGEGAEQLRVLLVANDEEEQEHFTKMLLADDAACRFNCDRVGRLGAGMMRLRDGSYEVVVADLSLPDSRGLDTVAGLRRTAPELPIVVMSGTQDEELAIQAVKAGAQDYLVKSEVTDQSLWRTLRYAVERKNTEEHLAYLAHHDQLTGLANRALFTLRASTTIANAWTRGTKPALLLLDLDRFKHTNDTLGHSVGDLLLIQVAERLAQCVGDPDALARLGGDEFALMVEQRNGKAEATALARQILKVLEADFHVKGHPISISASIGITVFPENGSDVEQLLGNADAAMYRAKDIGRSRYQYFDEEMHLKAVQWMELERELRGALERNEFELHYQPQVDCKTNKIVSFEALLRWTHHKLGPVGPFRFVPVLEGIGLIDKVGEWVLRQSCLQLAKWRRHSPDLRMAVNVSAIQFEKGDLASIVRSAVDDAGLPHDALELEITEGLLMKDFNKTLSTLEEINALGVRIAIDDFGTGYSNLSYIAKFPIDVLKIDKSITDMVGAHEGDSIAHAVVELSHALGIEVLAEGVETEAQLVFLRATKVETYQGYLFAKPMSSSTCDAFLGFGCDRTSNDETATTSVGSVRVVG
ncbi:MAG: EAL domain-containing protein [Myxococcales bacterium]|nr:EAL domain-containing protein [Myxococcales bacterium]